MQLGLQELFSLYATYWFLIDAVHGALVEGSQVPQRIILDWKEIHYVSSMKFPS